MNKQQRITLTLKFKKLQALNLELFKNKILDEINKCVVLCSNCHFESHFDVDFFNDNYDEIYNKSKNIKEKSYNIDRKIVKDMYNNGIKQIDISKELNTSKSAISGIIKELKTKNLIYSNLE
jgi:DNA-binding transcriptional regulator GbsR (MarR family)